LRTSLLPDIGAPHVELRRRDLPGEWIRDAAGRP
jgi:hypothetical protein